MAEEEDAVQVAVRMRVFNAREKAANAERIVRMENLSKGSKTYILDPDTREERDYKYDYSFQSHSDSEPGIGDWATQDTVMNTLGIPVLNAALEGRNVSLFAYGQTGSGKSFSMLGKVGVPELEGIIPRTCKEIFRRIKADSDPKVSYAIDIQVVEVYCEMINDLLADRKVWPAQGHKPRLTPKDGYVVDTIKKPCNQYDDIWTAMEFADKNRSVGSHALNPESSRAHTIYQINYCQVTKNDAGGVGRTITAKLNLIDLAGSERTDSAGTTGQMLKEGNAINLSLTALGGCIKALSENKKPNFRDSKLTLLLQASMTAGKVIMIAALSPASINYAETLSTLRFADRIKQVKIKSAKNVSEDPVAEMKKAMEEMRIKMQQEIDQLRSSLGMDPDAVVGGGDELNELQKMLEEQADAESKLKQELEDKIRTLQETSEERAARGAAINDQWSQALGGVSNVRKEDEKRPFFVNLHEDERITETLVYAFDPGENVIGKTNKDEPPKIELTGLGIIKNHCTVTVTPENQVFIEAYNSRTLVNGKKLKGRQELFHQNRVWLGNNYAFRFHHPGFESRGEKLPKDPDYFTAEAEIASGEVGGGAAAEGGDGTDVLSTLLRHKLAEAEKKVEQATLIATDLERDIVFSPKLFENRHTHETNVVVHVQIGTQSLVWPWEKFTVRLADMVSLWSEWQQCELRGEKLREREPRDDPFVDMESQLIGETDVWLNALANMVEFAAETTLLSVFGQMQGPWEDDDEDLDPFTDNPADLLDKTIQFEVAITQCSLGEQYCGVNGRCKYENVFVRYKFNAADDTEEFSKTNEDASGQFNLNFKYSKKHKVKVTKDVLQHICKGKITFQVWGSLSTEAAREAARPATAGTSQRLEVKKRELEDLERRVQDLQKKLEKKSNLINDKNKELLELDRQIAAAKKKA